MFWLLSVGCSERGPIDLPQAMPHLATQLEAHALQAQWVDAPVAAGVGPAYQVRAGGTRVYVEGDRLTAIDARATAPTWAVGLSLARWGSPDALRPALPGLTAAAGGRAEIRRPGIIEWVDGTPRGPEHGFTVIDPPAGDELVLELVVTGGRPRALGDRVRIRTSGGGIDWAELVVWDDDRRRLPASFEVEGQLVRVRADVSGARYPVTVDPLLLLTDGPRTVSGVPGPSLTYLGAALALDEGRVLLGDPGAPGGAGNDGMIAIVRPEQGGAVQWSTTDPTVDRFGSAVALHGHVAVVAGVTDELTLYHFTSGLEPWAQAGTATLKCADCTGIQLDLGDDLLVAGMPDDDGGTVQVWARGADAPTALDELFVGSATGASDDRLGGAVATDGAFVVAGAPGAGRVRVWRYGEGELALIDDLLLAGSALGASVDLDGNRLAVGAPTRGEVRVYRVDASGAALRQVLIAPPLASEGFGSRVAIADSSLAVLDAPDDGVPQVHLYERTGGVWLWRDAYPAGAAGEHPATLALSGDWLVVGTPDQAEYTVWSRTGDVLTYVDELTSPDDLWVPGGVAVDGETIAVGNYQPDALICPGVAVFEREDADTGFALLQVLTDCEVSYDDDDDALGFSVALAEHDLVVAGNPGYGYFSFGRAAIWTYNGSLYDNVQRVYSPDVVGTTYVGASVATDGQRVVVGQPTPEGEDGEYPRSHVYTRDEAGQWVLDAGISFSVDPYWQDGLGWAVGAGSEWTAVGGKPFGPTSTPGFVGVYAPDGEPILEAYGAENFDLSGQSVAMDGDRMAFGAPGAGAEDEGEVHIYDFDEVGVAHEQTILGDNGAIVAVDGQRVVVTQAFDAPTRVYGNLAGDDWTLLAEHEGFARGASGRLVVIEDKDGSLDVYQLEAENLPPSVRPDAYTTAADGAANVVFGSVLENDSDADLDPLTAALVAVTKPDPATVTVTLEPDGTFRLIGPPEGVFPAEVQFTYSASDGKTSAAAEVTVTLAVEPTPPPQVREVSLTGACTGCTTGAGGAAPLGWLAWLIARRRSPAPTRTTRH